jgi:hypothetical protein
MDKSWQSQHSLQLEEEALLGLLMASAGASSLPARPWPFVAGCQRLASDLPQQSEFRAPARFSHQPTATKVAERWLRALADRKIAIPEGRGNTARWMFDEGWLRGLALVASGLPESEASVWRSAGHVLTTCLSTWRNISSAAASNPSPSIGGQPRT